MADRGLTGVLLVGGASSRFGSPKALAEVGGETLAARSWRVLQEACDEVIAVGKGDELLPFPVLADGVEECAAIHGVVAGLRAASNDVAVVLPVDCPRITADVLRALASACRDAAVPQTGPLPGAYRKSALAALESGELKLSSAIAGLDVAVVQIDEALLADVDTRAELDAL